MFQFALPHGERLIPMHRICGQWEFQFALPHGERLNRRILKNVERVVSIRAPAWGATYPADSSRFEQVVSIRAPAWGATNKKHLTADTLSVSIRAPAWGATLSIGNLDFCYLLFQFALPHGERRIRIHAGLRRILFQFALPHGERRKNDVARSNMATFQFALPHGERPCRMNSNFLA